MAVSNEYRLLKQKKKCPWHTFLIPMFNALNVQDILGSSF